MRRSPLQHCTLIDRTLVGDFTAIDRRGLILQRDPFQATGIATGLEIEPLQPVSKPLAYRFTGQHLRIAGVRRQARQLSALVQTGKYQRTQTLAIRRCDHQILNIGRTLEHGPVSQRPHADKYPGGQFEVLGQSSIEHQPPLRVARIGQLDGIT